MSRRDDEPAQLRDVLDVLSGRLRRVDLRVIDQVRALWPTVVDAALAEHCRAEFIKDGVLLVSVPSGAYAQRIRLESAAILERLAVLGDAAPTSLRAVLS